MLEFMEKLIQDQVFTQKKIMQTRLMGLAGTVFILSFMFLDLQLLPSSLHQVYLDSRLYMQAPVCALFIGLTFTPFYPKIHQQVVCCTILVIIYANYWLILQCWQLQGFVFPYEGTVAYCLFALFVFRIKFTYALFFVAVTLIGFAYLMVLYPIYADRNTVNFGFILSSLLIGLLGVYQLERFLNKLSELNKQLAHLSQIDQLTKILNRGTYENRFSHLLELNKRNGNSLCVFFIDLDNFKAYNDGYGHLQGDEIIKLQADMLKSIFRRDTDIVARYGGEEYAVVVSNLTQQQCIDKANKIVQEWQHKKIPHGKVAGQEYVSCSVGFYQEKVNKDSSKESLVSRADKALYQAKSQGRGRFVQWQ